MNIPAVALPLAIGTVLAIVALSVVLAPLLSDKDNADDQLNATKPTNTNAEGTAIAALREIEFDKATGKLSDKDYDALRMMYTRDALAELRAADNLVAASVQAGGPVTDDMIEAAIRRAKNAAHDCTVCGPRPEPDGVFCSSCGRHLAGNCGKCGTKVEMVGARFCTGCGEGLAAALFDVCGLVLVRAARVVAREFRSLTDRMPSDFPLTFLTASVQWTGAYGIGRDRKPIQLPSDFSDFPLTFGTVSMQWRTTVPVIRNVDLF